MNAKKILWIGAVAAIILTVSVTWIACKGIPDDPEPGATITVSASAPGVAPSTAAAPTRIKRLDSPNGNLQAEFIPPPSTDLLILRVSLTNPDEVFLVFNYSYGVPVTFSVTSGSGRFLDVEAYNILAGSSTSNKLNAEHYYTTTDSGLRMLDLSGDAQTVSIDLAMSSVGMVTGGSVLDYSFSGMTGHAPVPAAVKPSASVPTTPAPLPLSCNSNCPLRNTFYTNVSDPAWGLSFPTIPTPIYGGSATGLTVSNLPLDRPLVLTTFSSDSLIYSSNPVNLTTPSAPVNLTFTGWIAPYVTFCGVPSVIIPFQSVSVNVHIYGGWGGIQSASLGTNDSCGGTLNGPFTQSPPLPPENYFIYSFTAPSSGSCLVDVIASDCGCPSWGPNSAEGTRTINITGSGW
jgi:hypothetical protein